MPDRSDSFDARRFAAWLRRYMESEGLRPMHVIGAGGLSAAHFYSFYNGITGRARQEGRDAPYDPTFSAIAKLATALQLPAPYLLEKAGVAQGARMVRFSAAEQTLLYQAIGAARLELSQAFTPEQHRTLEKLHDELLEVLTTPTQEESHGNDD